MKAFFFFFEHNSSHSGANWFGTSRTPWEEKKRKRIKKAVLDIFRLKCLILDLCRFRMKHFNFKWKWNCVRVSYLRKKKYFQVPLPLIYLVLYPVDATHDGLSLGHCSLPWDLWVHVWAFKKPSSAEVRTSGAWHRDVPYPGVSGQFMSPRLRLKMVFTSLWIFCSRLFCSDLSIKIHPNNELCFGKPS